MQEMVGFSQESINLAGFLMLIGTKRRMYLVGG